MAKRSDGRCECSACVAHPRSAEAKEHTKINRLLTILDEKAARRVLGLLAEWKGHGGVSELSRVTGMSRTTILLGQQELEKRDTVPRGRVRRSGGGRISLEKKLRN